MTQEIMNEKEAIRLKISAITKNYIDKYDIGHKFNIMKKMK